MHSRARFADGIQFRDKYSYDCQSQPEQTDVRYPVPSLSFECLCYCLACLLFVALEGFTEVEDLACKLLFTLIRVPPQKLDC